MLTRPFIKIGATIGTKATVLIYNSVLKLLAQKSQKRIRFWQT